MKALIHNTLSKMKNAQTIISLTTLSCGQFSAQQVHTFDSPANTLAFVRKFLKDELDIARKSTPELDSVLSEGDPMHMWNSKEGSFGYDIGTNGYRFAYLNTQPEYKVSDKEAATVLERFANSGRSTADYRRVAESVSSGMHRYCQNELWKFVKALIRAFATGGFDLRNRTAHDEAQDIALHMDANNL